jgi:phosphohistidine phosphatase SixA
MGGGARRQRVPLRDNSPELNQSPKFDMFYVYCYGRGIQKNAGETMLTLIYQRHTKFNRPPGNGHITQEGREILDQVADKLIARGLRPDRVDVSPATRGVESAEEEIIHFREGGHIIEGPRVVEELDDHHKFNDFLRELKKTPDSVKTLLCLSHENPVITHSRDLLVKSERAKLPMDLEHAGALVLTFNVESWNAVEPGTAVTVEHIQAPGAEPQF